MEQTADELGIEHIRAQITHLLAESGKLLAEQSKLHREAKYYPFIAIAAFIAAVAAVGKIFFGA